MKVNTPQKRSLVKNFKEMIQNNKESKKDNVFGVIIGDKATIYDEEKKQYVKKLKLIDDTFNFTEKNEIEDLTFHKFILVTLYSKEESTFDKLFKLGDIIYLRRFYFNILKYGNYQGLEVEFSNWLLFDRENKMTPTKYKVDKNNTDRKLTEAETKRIKELRNFVKEFFKSNSLSFIDWYVDHKSDNKEEYKSFNSKKIKKLKDMICLVTKEKDGMLHVKDILNNEFKMKKPESSSYKKGDILYIKIADFDLEKKEISLDEKFSRIYDIPKTFFDSNDLKSGKKRDEIKDFIFNHGKMDIILKEYPFLKDYNPEGQHFINKSKPVKNNKKYMLLKNTTDKFTNMKFENILKFVEKPTKNKNSKCLLECKIQSLDNHHNNYNNIVKLYCKVCKNNKNFNFKPVICCKNKMKINLNLILNVSSLDNDKTVPVYFMSFNNEDMFGTWKILPKSNNVDDWKNIKSSDLNLFISKLKEMIEEKPSVKLALEFSEVNKKGVLKGVDSLFLPYN